MPYHRIVRALYSYEAQDSEELSFSEDELLCIQNEDSSIDSEWLHAKSLKNGDTSGIIPANYIESIEGIGSLKAVYEYKAQEDNELTIAEDESLILLEKLDEDWWLVKNEQNQYGLIPSNYVEEGTFENLQEPDGNVFDLGIQHVISRPNEGQRKTKSETIKSIFPNASTIKKWHAEIKMVGGEENARKGKLVELDNGILLFSQGKQKIVEFSHRIEEYSALDVDKMILSVIEGHQYSVSMARKDAIEVSRLIKENKPFLPGPLVISDAVVSSKDINENQEPVESSLLTSDGVKSPEPCNNTFEMKALYDYCAGDSDEVSIDEDDTVIVLDDNGKEWWRIRKIDGTEGLVPKSYLVNDEIAHMVDPTNSSPVQGDAFLEDDISNLRINDEDAKEEEEESFKEAAGRNCVAFASPPPPPPLPTLARNIPIPPPLPKSDDLSKVTAPPPPPLPTRPTESPRLSNVVQIEKYDFASDDKESPSDVIVKNVKTPTARAPLPTKAVLVSPPLVKREIQEELSKPKEDLRQEFIETPQKQMMHARTLAPPPPPLPQRNPHHPAKDIPKRSVLSEENHMVEKSVENSIPMIQRRELSNDGLKRSQSESEKDTNTSNRGKVIDVAEPAPRPAPKAIVSNSNPWAKISLKKTKDIQPSALNNSAKNMNNLNNLPKALPNRPSNIKSGQKPLPSEARLWKDNSGKFQTEAAFISFDDGMVTIYKLNGSKVNIPIDMLSDRDREYVYRKSNMTPQPRKVVTTGSPAPIDTQSYIVNGFDWLQFLIGTGLDSARAVLLGRVFVEKRLNEIWLESINTEKLKASILGISDTEALLVMQGVTKKRLQRLETLGKDRLLANLNSSDRKDTNLSSMMSSPSVSTSMIPSQIPVVRPSPMQNPLQPKQTTMKHIQPMRPQNTLSGIQIPSQPMYREYMQTGAVTLPNGQVAQQTTTTQYMAARRSGSSEIAMPVMPMQNSSSNMWLPPHNNKLYAATMNPPPLMQNQQYNPSLTQFSPSQNTQYLPNMMPMSPTPAFSQMNNTVKYSMHPSLSSPVFNPSPYNSSANQIRPQTINHLPPQQSLNLPQDKYSVFRMIDPAVPSVIVSQPNPHQMNQNPSDSFQQAQQNCYTMDSGYNRQ